MRFLATVPILILLACTAVADIYRWQDEQGRVHYGDQPPPEKAAERVEPKSAPADPEAAGQLDTIREEMEQRREQRRAAREQRQAEREAERARAERCAAAQAELARFEAVPPLRRGVTDDDGTPRVLTPEEYEEWHRNLRRQVEQACNGA